MKKDECPCKWKACKRAATVGPAGPILPPIPNTSGLSVKKGRRRRKKRRAKPPPPFRWRRAGWFLGVRPVLPCSAHKRRAIPSTFPPGRWDCSGPGAGLARGVEFDLVSAAHRRIEGDVEMIVGGCVCAVHRLVIHAHHIGELVSEQAVQHTGSSAAGFRPMRARSSSSNCAILDLWALLMI